MSYRFDRTAMAKRMHRETTGNIRNLPYYIDNTVSQEMNNKYFKTVESLALQGFFFFFWVESSEMH
jgi:hypothetical protein